MFGHFMDETPGSSLTRCRAIFDHVADLPPEERAVALERLCAGDDVTQREVERLLASHDALAGFLGTAAIWNTGPPDLERLGAYELVRKLGEGGMGRVYLAEPGPVAVKVIRRDLDVDLVRRRFTQERDLLSRLEHPGIARLLDDGVADDGSLYLVLEYVDGVPVDHFCRTLGLRERLEVFSAVCEAVAHAHGRLVVHRDLKPANILVTTGGIPVVLDFGLAKLARTTPAMALDSTRTGHRLLTPEYASPEQIRGLRTTPAVDIYALGLILYELLAGARPHRFTTWSMAEIVDVICNRTVPPPSSATVYGRSGIAPDALRGDLDFIVMKAIAKSSHERYAHVAELQDDLHRHLRGGRIPGVERRT